MHIKENDCESIKHKFFGKNSHVKILTDYLKQRNIYAAPHMTLKVYNTLKDTHVALYDIYIEALTRLEPVKHD